jgi:hypothetical protein
MFASFYTVLHTVILLVDVSDHPTFVTVFAVLALTIIHLGFAGAYYALYWRQTVVSLVIPMTAWATMVIYWQIFALAVLISPSAFFIYKVVIKTKATNKASAKEHARRGA